MNRRTLSPKEVERIYEIPAKTLANMRCMKVGIPYIKCGKKVLYDTQDIEAYLARNKIKVMSQ